jgi:hypothetical protein
MAGDYTIKECFSKDAPGAQEFSNFEKNMQSKLKSAGAVEPSGGDVPDGVPLSLDSTMKMGNVSIPGMSPEQAAKINEMMKNRPPVQTSTVVEKIESEKLASDAFTVPAGFTKKELPTSPAMPMRMPPAAGASPAAH